MRQFPPDRGAEAAFVGRSNAGKSSAINAISGRRNLARVSKLPGRTQQINFFSLGDGQRLVDLPGYGYARAPVATKARWQRLIEDYLRHRQSLCGLVLLMDIRHPLAALDGQILDWCNAVQLSVHILLTKADKMSRGAAMAVQHDVVKRVRERYGAGGNFSVQIFSALKATGVADVRARLCEWLQ